MHALVDELATAIRLCKAEYEDPLASTDESGHDLPRNRRHTSYANTARPYENRNTVRYLSVDIEDALL